MDGANRSDGPFDPTGRADSTRSGGHVGALLQSARMEMGESIDAVAESLRIRQAYLEAIESGEFDRLPGHAYAVGFVRAYADHLGLHSDEIVRRFKEEDRSPGPQADLDFPVPSSDGGLPALTFVIVALVLGAAAYGGWHYLYRSDTPVAELIPDIPERLATLLESSPDGSVAPSVDTASGGTESAPDGVATTAQAGTATTDTETGSEQPGIETVVQADAAAAGSTETGSAPDEGSGSAEAPVTTAGETGAVDPDSNAPSTDTGVASGTDGSTEIAAADGSSDEAQAVAEDGSGAPAATSESTPDPVSTLTDPVSVAEAAEQEPANVQVDQDRAEADTETVASSEQTASSVTGTSDPAPAVADAEGTDSGQTDTASAVSEDVTAVVAGVEPADDTEPDGAGAGTGVEGAEADTAGSEAAGSVPGGDDTTTATEESGATTETQEPVVASEDQDTADPEPEVAETQDTTEQTETAEAPPPLRTGVFRSGGVAVDSDGDSATAPPPAPAVGAAGSQQAQRQEAFVGNQAPDSVRQSSGGARVVLRAQGESWIQIQQGGNLVVRRLMKPGDVYAVPNQSGLSLNTGNAGALEVYVDGARAPSVGPRGAVRNGISLDPARLKSGR